MKKMPRVSQSARVRIAIIASGAILAGSQVLLIRRAMALAGGDEVIFAMTLVVWLLSVSAGSAIGSRLAKRVRNSARVLAIGLIFLALAAFSSLILLHLASALTHWIPGTVPGGGGLFLALLISLFPVGAIGGALFPFACKVLAEEEHGAVSSAYLLEAAGSFLAGTITALVFAPHFGGLSLALLLALVGIGAAVIILRPGFPLWLTLLFLILIGLFAATPIRFLETRLFALLRPGMEVRDLLETPYGIIEVTERQGQMTIYENGLLLALSDDQAGSEERSHLVLAQHPRPQSVLWIGGSLGGALEEALRHSSITRFDVVELNPVLFSLQKYFGQQSGKAIGEEDRVILHRQDGRRFISLSQSQSYDVITLNLPGPRTARLAKFYTVEAFRLIRQRLKPGGVLVFSIQTPGDFIGKDLSSLLSSLHETCLAVFDQVVVLPGENALFIAGDRQAKPAVTAQEIDARLRKRGIQPIYWDRYRLQDRLSESRKLLLQEALISRSELGLNRDDAPICFYLQQVLWSQQVRGGLPGILKVVRGVFLPACLVIMGIAFLVALILRFVCSDWLGGVGAGWAVISVGLSGVSLEILALIAYQIQFGSGYREIGLLMGLYMAGLSIGATFTRKVITNRAAIFRIVQSLWVMAPLGLVLLTSLGMVLPSLPPTIGRATFCFYMLLIGFLGGLHFPLAVAYAGPETASRAGILYSLDLMGSACGALVVGLFALPLLGLRVTAFGLMALNLLPLILLLKKAGDSKKPIQSKC